VPVACKCSDDPLHPACVVQHGSVCHQPQVVVLTTVLSITTRSVTRQHINTCVVCTYLHPCTYAQAYATVACEHWTMLVAGALVSRALLGCYLIIDVLSFVCDTVLVHILLSNKHLPLAMSSNEQPGHTICCCRWYRWGVVPLPGHIQYHCCTTCCTGVLADLSPVTTACILQDLPAGCYLNRFSSFLGSWRFRWCCSSWQLTLIATSLSSSVAT
jgi:hypothetical protein